MNMPLNQGSNERLQEIASQFPFPPTPDVARSVIDRLESRSRSGGRLRSAWVFSAILVLLLAILFAVPSVRAEIIRFFQVGVVRIFPASATQTAIPSLPQTPLTATPASLSQSTRTPGPTVTPYTSQSEPIYSITTSDLAGETTLEAARDSLPFPIKLPTYPSDLGAPDRVFLQENGQMVILVWTDPDNSESARLSLHEIAKGNIMVSKYQPIVVQETQVHGQYAVWAVGPYMVQLTSGSYAFRRTVEGNTLIWEENEITYRLETDLSLEEAVKIGESLK